MDIKKINCFLLTLFTLPSFATEPNRGSLFLYFVPQTYVGSIMFAQPQMDVVPQANRNNLNVLVARVFTSTDNSCTSTISDFDVTLINSDSANLVNAQTYSTSDASSYSLFGPGQVYPVNGSSGDMRLWFSSDGLNPVGSFSPCIQASTMVCTATNDCGYPQPINWNL